MIYTGYWAKLDEYKANNLIPVGISGWSPDGYTGLRYPALAPKYSWWKRWHDEHLSEQWYVEQYYSTVLNTLNPNTVATQLQSMGENVVLLCFETPEKFCHRHIVAKWLREKANITVAEYQLQSNQKTL